MRRHRRGRIVIVGTLQKPNEFIGIVEAAAPQPFSESHPAGQFPFEKVTPRATSSVKKVTPRVTFGKGPLTFAQRPLTFGKRPLTFRKRKEFIGILKAI